MDCRATFRLRLVSIYQVGKGVAERWIRAKSAGIAPSRTSPPRSNAFAIGLDDDASWWNDWAAAWQDLTKVKPARDLVRHSAPCSCRQRSASSRADRILAAQLVQQDRRRGRHPPGCHPQRRLAPHRTCAARHPKLHTVGIADDVTGPGQGQTRLRAIVGGSTDQEGAPLDGLAAARPDTARSGHDGAGLWLACPRPGLPGRAAAGDDAGRLRGPGGVDRA